MGNRRMFSLKVVDTDEFLDMPQSSQLLYFHLAMRADDDGFVNSPKKIMRFAGAKDDDLKVIIAKQFIIPFQSGVIVIKHWKEHNSIRKDRKVDTIYKEEMALLSENSDGIYNLRTNDNQMTTKQPPKLSKDKLSKDKLSKDKLSNIADESAEQKNQTNLILDIFYKFNPMTDFKNTTQRKAVDELIKKIGFEELKGTVELALKAQEDKYSPRITTPLQLKNKFGDLKSYLQGKINDQPKTLYL